MSKRTMLVAYASLVGIPLLGLIGIVHGGRRLRAPLSVGGNWNLRADFTPWAGKTCGNLLSVTRQPAFSISQSGTILVLALNNAQATAFRGTIQGTELTAGAEDPSAGGDAACDPEEAIHLNAVVKKTGAQATLTGTLKLNSCATCAPVAFEAVRQASAKKGGQ